MGMGVDSNVLIFERIREELRWGRVRLAVDGGYDKALLNDCRLYVTTLITGVALFLFAGPIKGFCRDLMSRIGINLFTALIGTKSSSTS